MRGGGMNERNSVRVYACDETVQWPDAWPELPVNNHRLGSKLIDQNGKKVWVEATEADLRKTLKKYGHTDAEIEELALRFGYCTANASGGCNSNHCDLPWVCKLYHDVENSLNFCQCERI
jgi:hypothetical protein